MHDSEPLSHKHFAAIYCRISSDKSGASAGVERQEGDCRALAKRLGLTVTHVLVDNDISAYSGKPRPQYRRLLELMKQSEIGTVLAFHQDRLQRSPVELEEYVDVSEAGQVTTHTVLAGHIDLSTPTGRFNARIIGAAARYEVEHMIERQRAAKLQHAKDGKYMGGQRPYGFEPKRLALRESEAAVVREMAERVIHGEPTTSIAVDLNERGITTQHGKKWLAVNVHNVLTRHINAGIVLHKGVEYDAESPAILDRDTWADLQAAIEQSRLQSGHSGRYRKHLLNGLLFCGLCGQKLYHKQKQQRDGSYRAAAACGRTAGTTGKWVGCGGVSRQVDPIIDLVTDAVIYRLDSPQLVKALRRNKLGDRSLRDLLTKQRSLERRLNTINDDFYVNELLSRDEYERLKLTTAAELKAINQNIEQAGRGIVLPDGSLNGDLRQAWEQATDAWRRGLLFKLIEQIVVQPKPKTEGYYPPRYKDQWWFDPELVEIRWKL
ncbi:recombinase family protein [Mycolicibacterium neoaurum]|uniref:recombinase family protein n=1 Tax=Mycolicibacterium neoaurum TaxID=1795 RepID=UPI001F4CE19A|nr:recombinase family protein [Mycolicibacterium neoaurum]